MYKVFIIEDEYLIRNNLREQITVLGSYYQSLMSAKLEMVRWHCLQLSTYSPTSF